MMELDKYFLLKIGSTGSPNIYIGGKFLKIVFTNGVEAYKLIYSQYIQVDVKNLEDHL